MNEVHATYFAICQRERSEVRSSKLDDVLEVDDVFRTVLLHDLALPEEVQLIFLYRKRS